jgi:CheY-like chemotaxis protein
MNTLNFNKEDVKKIVEQYRDGDVTPRIKQLMEKYESETGKYAVWRDKITEGFKKYLMGEKIYDRNKERVSLYVSEDKKNQWQEFLKEHNINTISRLIRLSVKTYIENFNNHAIKEGGLSTLSHSLKSPLTVIKGYSQFILENNREDISDDVAETLQNIFDKSIILENKINNMLDNIDSKSDYDILLIEDDLATIRLVKSYFKSKGYICKGVVSGSKGLEELRENEPKIILLDIILPDLTGYNICKKIKKDKDLKEVPLYFLTAISKKQVDKELRDVDPELHPDGYIPKPFDFSDFSILFQYLEE